MKYFNVSERNHTMLHKSLFFKGRGYKLEVTVT